MAEIESHDYDVIVIGAGGAGLRAAIESVSRGLRTALICKSLLGKAHTVMAEGGVAAAMGTSTKDNWKVHFRDTMRGGKMLNNWRMAELHAQEAPDRVLELEAWGLCSTAPRTARSSSVTSAATAMPGSPTWATDRPRADPHAPAARRLHGHRRLHGVQDPAPALRLGGPGVRRRRLLAPHG